MSKDLAPRTNESPDIHTPKAELKGLSQGKARVEKLQIRMTATEAMEAGGTAARHRVEASRLKKEATSKAKELNDLARLEEGKAVECERQSITHFKTADVTVHEFHDYKRNEVLSVREDTTKRLNSRTMRTDERQVPLVGIAGPPAEKSAAAMEPESLGFLCVGILVAHKRADPDHPGLGAGALRQQLRETSGVKCKSLEVHAALKAAVTIDDLSGTFKHVHTLKHPLEYYDIRFPALPDNVVSINGKGKDLPL